MILTSMDFPTLLETPNQFTQRFSSLKTHLQSTFRLKNTQHTNLPLSFKANQRSFTFKAHKLIKQQKIVFSLALSTNTLPHSISFIKTIKMTLKHPNLSVIQKKYYPIWLGNWFLSYYYQDARRIEKCFAFKLLNLVLISIHSL